MLASPMDPDTADALLDGAVPPGLEHLAAWLSAVRPGPSGGGDPLERLAVDALTNAGRRAAAPNGRRRLAARLLTAKTVAIAGTIAVGGMAAAAATGTLPAPVQSALAQGLHHVGVTIPADSSGTVTAGSLQQHGPPLGMPAGPRGGSRPAWGRIVRPAAGSLPSVTAAGLPAATGGQACAPAGKRPVTESLAVPRVPGHLLRRESPGGSKESAGSCGSFPTATRSGAASASAGVAQVRRASSAVDHRDGIARQSPGRGERPAPPAHEARTHGRLGSPGRRGSKTGAPAGPRSGRSTSHARPLPHPSVHRPDRAEGHASVNSPKHSTVAPRGGSERGDVG